MVTPQKQQARTVGTFRACSWLRGQDLNLCGQHRGRLPKAADAVVAQVIRLPSCCRRLRRVATDGNRLATGGLDRERALWSYQPAFFLPTFVRGPDFFAPPDFVAAVAFFGRPGFRCLIVSLLSATPLSMLSNTVRAPSFTPCL